VETDLSDAGIINRDLQANIGHNQIKSFRSKLVHSIISVTGLRLTMDSIYIKVDSIKQLVAIVSPLNASNKTIIWNSSNNSIATVTSSGVLEGLSMGRTTVTASSAEGNFTAIINITVSQDTNLVHETLAQSIEFYPNPATNSVTIKNLPANSSIKVFDSIGRIVLIPVTKNTIDVSGLRSGAYLVQIVSKNTTIDKLLIKK